MRWISNLLVFYISILLITLSGCISTFYSPRIVEPNTTIMGGGVSGDYVYTYGDINYGFPAFGLFARRGYENGFDAGLGINTNYLPIGIEGSVRKQFDVPFYIIDGIVFELGGNLGITHYGLAYSVSFIYKDFGVTISRQNIKGTIYWIGFDPYSSSFQTVENSLKLSYTLDLNSYRLPVFLRVYTEKNLNAGQYLCKSLVYYNDELNVDKLCISVGVGIYFDI